MRVWIDIANSPHVGLFDPVVKHMHDAGWEVLLTARDHAQTAELARERWPDVSVVGGESPRNRFAKAASAATRAAGLRALARRFEPDVALSHGSYAQILAARLLRVPAVTMMDYEYQPANHVSFRLARRVIVPDVFPEAQLRRYGVRAPSVRRYAGFKEDLYLPGFVPATDVLTHLGVDGAKIVVVLRPPPSGALYHPSDNANFDRIVGWCAAQEDVEAIVLPRYASQREQYAGREGLIVPAHAVDGLSLLARADALIGAGGTMNREAALLGTATYTLFAGRLAAVDSELVDMGLMTDLRSNGTLPVLRKREHGPVPASRERGDALLALILETLTHARREVS
jgi:uncharacterized protein